MSDFRISDEQPTRERSSWDVRALVDFENENYGKPRAEWNYPETARAANYFTRTSFMRRPETFQS